MSLKGVSKHDQGLLEAAGLWPGFRAFRAKLTKRGRNALAASEEALKSWIPDDLTPRDPDANCLPAGSGYELIDKMERSCSDLPIAPDALAGKTAMEPEVARWVARNIDNPSADPADCPDPFAWTLLRYCRDDPAFAMMFIKDIWTKLLVAQARQGDDGGDEKMDGTPTVELIRRIRLLRDKSQHSGVEQLAARVAHTHEVGGSSPPPAILSLSGEAG